MIFLACWAIVIYSAAGSLQNESSNQISFFKNLRAQYKDRTAGVFGGGGAVPQDGMRYLLLDAVATILWLCCLFTPLDEKHS